MFSGTIEIKPGTVVALLEYEDTRIVTRMKSFPKGRVCFVDGFDLSTSGMFETFVRDIVPGDVGLIKRASVSQQLVRMGSHQIYKLGYGDTTIYVTKTEMRGLFDRGNIKIINEN